LGSSLFVLPYPFPHLVERMSTVLLLECVPCETERRKTEVAEVPTTGNDVSWAMQFKQKRFAGLQCAELSIAGRLPEVNLVRLLGAEIAEPIVIGYSDKEPHGQDYNYLTVFLMTEMDSLSAPAMTASSSQDVSGVRHGRLNAQPSLHFCGIGNGNRSARFTGIPCLALSVLKPELLPKSTALAVQPFRGNGFAVSFFTISVQRSIRESGLAVQTNRGPVTLNYAGTRLLNVWCDNDGRR
jgi:hypothetical protein